MIDDYDRLDYCDVTSVEDLRPFLAHVLDGLTPDDQARFLGDLGRIAHQMRTERAAHPDITDRAWIVLETARLDGNIDVTPRYGPRVESLAAAGLVELADTDRPHLTRVTPKGEW